LQAQQDEYRRDATANIVNELAVDRTSLVHTETKEGERTIRGSVSAPRRARNDPNTSDWQQALANYVAELEAHVDEFQGDPGYTLVDDRLNYSKNAIITGVEWSVSPGQIYEFDYEASVTVGSGVFQSRAIDLASPTINTAFDTMLRLDGTELTGMRDYRVSKTIEADVNAVFNRDSAENNDVVPTGGPQRTVTFEGEWYGTLADRQNKDATLDNLVATKNNVTLETRFPGYSIDGYVTRYTSELQQQSGGNSHRYRLEFVEGQRA
jgi:hypothetical protein